MDPKKIEKFENMDSLLNTLTLYAENIDNFKLKLIDLLKIKNSIIKNDRFCDFGLIISNFDLKKDLLMQQIDNKTKLFNIFINRLYLDLCYIQSLLMNVENILFELNIFAEKKIDTNIFKKKNLKLAEFKEIVNIIINNYFLITKYLEKFYLKIRGLTNLIGNQICTKKISNTLYIQFDKLILEKEKIFNLINQTINFYNDITNQYLKIDDEKNYKIFIEEPDKVNTSFHDYADKHSELQIDSENQKNNESDTNSKDSKDSKDSNKNNYKDNHEIKIKTNDNTIFLKKNKILKEVDYDK